MNSTGGNSQADIVRLTKTAAKANVLGQWDVIAQYYGERGALLAAMQTPLRGASDLLKLDEQIRDRVRTVQAVLVSLLGEARRLNSVFTVFSNDSEGSLRPR
ncbi:MAG: hypothetical protein AABY61_02135 [Nitrospirota bacterium]